ncbi:hypothetical protein [Skermanella pratensis]|uniref:hypothetical protein n=1 Tax=Skermanella pratensis TaxID=2233999 RepID=UPI00130163B8|nr:hypothetical protein [Skermanella pratensis]
MVYDGRTEGDPAIDAVVALDDYPIQGPNTLVVLGINLGGPANYQGSLTIGSVMQPFSYQAASTANGIA